MVVKKDIHSIDNIELVFLTMDDYSELKQAMQEAYSNIRITSYNVCYTKLLRISFTN